MKDFTRKLIQDRDVLLNALQEIRRTKGPYDMNPIIHAQNTIQNLKEIADKAIEKIL